MMHKTRNFTRGVAFLAAYALFAATAARAADGPATSKEKEQKLIEVLRQDAPAADKAIACKQLAVYGSPDAVPDLARLLRDEQLASWARIALEAIPGRAADEALRKSMDSLQGRLLIGTINSIGVRRDARAIDPLTRRLKDPDADVASAAAVALGHIGNTEATQTLRQSLASAPADVRTAVAEGCVLCAERLLADGQAAEAVKIYDEVRRADVPKQRILEATRGAILARKSDGIPLLLEQLRSPDKAFFTIGLSTAREFSGRDVSDVLAAEVTRATPERAPLLLLVLADRNDTVELPAVLQAVRSGPKQVRIAAMGVLPRLGDASCVATLMETALESDAELAQAAKTALAGLPGEKVDAQITAGLPFVQGKALPILLELVGRRRIEATPALLKALDHPDAETRGAALTALGATVGPKDLSVLISQVVAPKHPGDTQVAQQALHTACVRMPDREACAGELVAALSGASVPTQCDLLETLGAVGGVKALERIGAAAKSSDSQIQDTASSLLGKWMNVDAAPVLLDLAKTTADEKYQARALRGYLRLVRQFSTPGAERDAMCKKAFDASKRAAEQKLVLEVLQLNPSLDTLKLAVKAIEVPELKEDAARVAMIIAQKLGDKAAGAKDLLAKVHLDPVKVEIVKAEYGVGTTQKDVTEALQKQVRDLPLISLPSSTYAAAFGDPLPGTSKQLKVQYRINGKAGEASFPDNAVIMLPTPK